MKSIYFLFVFFIINFYLKAQDSIVPLQEIVVLGNWAEKNMPISYLNIKKYDINRFNFGQDIPYILSNTPSLVESSDAGTGIGYTNFKIRGIDQTRINVTLNGVTLNDPESHQVFWVNMPDLSSSTELIQIQRGVGTSTNGTGAFGASINLNTLKINSNPYSTINLGFGSFNTQIMNISFGTGLINNRLGIDGRVSKIKSDGYIDRSNANLTSYYLSMYYLWRKSNFRINLFDGKEVTHQAWNGVPFSYIHDKSLRKYNSSGTEKDGNPYPNEIDNYGQTHFQFVYKQEFTKDCYQNITLHYTKGGGYFEQYKSNQSFSDYGIQPVIINNDTILHTDLVRDKWLDNDYFGIVYDIHYQKNNYDATLGAAYNEYYGKHFGKIVWAKYSSNSNNIDNYYNWRGKKNDANIYLKTITKINDFNIFSDLQYRFIEYGYNGFLNAPNSDLQLQYFHFFNPKIGYTWNIKNTLKQYLLIGVLQKEPNRDDFIQNQGINPPKSESLYDLEIGIDKLSSNFSYSVNSYFMYYRNQLINTGKLNDVGAAIRENVPISFRYGMELSAQYKINKYFSLNGNFNLCQNKIKDYISTIYDWSTFTSITTNLTNTNIAYSPNYVGNIELIYSALNNNKNDLNFSLIGKFVGNQYLDNTSNEFSKLPSYYYINAQANYTIKNTFFKMLKISVLVNNLTNYLYSSNGWIYRFQSEGTILDPITDPYLRVEGKNIYNQTGLYPQSGINILTRLTIGF